LEKIALIPAYQPDIKLLNIVADLKMLNFRTFVVNDGSDCPTSLKVFEKISYSCDVITLNKNCGKGAAIKHGLQKIKDLQLNDCIIVTIDADGQHLVKDAEKLINKLNKYDADIVLGVRNFYLTNIPLRSLIGNILTSYLVFSLNKKFLVDTQTGLRAFKYRVIDELIDIKEENYDWEFAVLNKFILDNKKIDTCEIETIYEKGNLTSHFGKIVDSAKIYFIFLKYSLSNIMTIIVEYFIFILFVYLNSSIFVALTCSRFCSLIFHFVAQKKITFKNNHKTELKQITGYSLLAIFNYSTSLIALTLLDSYFFSTIFLKIIIDICLSLVTFIVLNKLFSRR
jgi:putative flippase GtrA